MRLILLSADLAIGTYVLAQFLRWSRSPSDFIARLFRTLSLAILWLHVLLAFGIAHHWSHAAAWEHVAQRTATAVGWNSGAGLLFNEALLLWWTVDILWSWLSLSTYTNRSRWWTITLEIYLAFMFFTAALPFAPPERRWIGVIAFAILIIGWLISFRRRS